MFRNILRFFLVVFFTSFISQITNAQTVLINPAGDGGFENGSTFAANGWTEANSANNPWVIGTAIVGTPYSGNSAYVSNDGGITNAYTNSAASLNFFYRDIAVPAGETKIVLTFNWISNGEASYDLWQVFTAPTSVIPVGSTTFPGSGTSNVPSAITGATFIGYGQTQTTAQTATLALPSNLAGTTFRLIIAWKNDASGGTNPPAAIDNISLTSSLPVPLVGGNVYPINGTQNPPNSFGNIANAISYLYSDGITGSGQVIFELGPGYVGETGPITIGPIAGTSSSLGVTFRPATGYTASTSIAGLTSPNQFAIALDGCKYVTLDGRAGGIGSNRDWTISCTGSSYGQSAIRFLNTTTSTSNNIIRYCNLIGEATGTTSAIIALTVGTSPNLYQNNIIEYNLIESGTTIRGYAVSFGWSSSGLLNTGNILRYNLIRKFSENGIRITGTFPSLEIYNNDIYFAAPQTSSTSLYGIYCSSSSSNTGAGVKIYSNKIYDLLTTTTGVTIRGFYQGSGSFTGSPIQFFNNFIALGNGVTSNPIIYGIDINTSTSGTATQIYYNSVFIGGTATSGANNSMAFRRGYADLVLDVRDNIFYNTRTNSGGTGTHWAIGINTTTIGSLNYNDYYADGTGGILGTTDLTATGNKATLALWKAAVPADASSISQNPNYLNPIASPPDLKINTVIPTQLESGATSIAAVTTDFEGELRNATTPDIGADEFAGTPLDLTPPVISYTPLLNTSSTSSRTLTASITDAGSGIPTAGIGLPVLYWKQNFNGVWTGVTSATPTGSDYSFTFGGGNVGDTVYYYVAAQDGASTPNVGVFPSAGAGGFTANPPAAAIPPTTPSRYVIANVPLAGDYTVGASLFNRITGLNISFDKIVRKVMKEVEVVVPVQDGRNIKGSENKVVSSDQFTTTKKLMEVEETSWIPLLNGQPYAGDLYVKKAEHPEISFPDGIDGIYLTITAAVTDLNLRGVSAPVRFLLTDASYSTGETYPLTINITNESITTPVNTVTFKPNTGIASVITGGTAQNIFGIYDDYVVFDGSNIDGGTSRDLSIVNTYTGGSFNLGIVLWNNGVKAANDITVKNCVIEGTPTVTSSYGLFLNAAGGAFHNTSFINNKIQNCKVGIQFAGVTGSATNNGLISGNTIGDVAKPITIGGILGSYVDNLTIVGNEIYGQASGNTNTSQYGIALIAGSTNCKVQKNLIHDFYYTGTSGYGCYGIRYNAEATSINEISNNFIHNIKADGDASSLSYTPAGIYVITGGNLNIYYNSIYLSGNTLGQGYNGRSACISIASGISLLNIRDNIFQNSMGSFPGSTKTNVTYGVYSESANSVFTDINYNDYFANGVGPYVGYLGGNQSDLTAWQTATGKDVNSISADPKFNSNTDLHINTGFNAVDAKAQYLAAVLTDYDNDVRDGSTPDIGADEYIYIPPSVLDPTGVSATPISDSQIDVAFTPNGNNNNVVIVFNLDGVFTAPSGTPPTPGDPFANGILLYNGVTSPFSHTGLTGSTHYYYKLFSYDGSNYSTGVATDGITLPSPVNPPYAQDFEGSTFPPTGWTTYGDKLWTSGTEAHSGLKCARIAYSPAGTGYLQMPDINLPASPNYRIKFWWKDDDISTAMMNKEKGKKNNKGTQKGTKNLGDGIEVAGYDTTFFEISTNGGSSWIVLTFLSAASYQSTYSEVIQNLDAYAGQTISIRWRDWSDGTFDAYGTGLDDITVEEIPSCPEPTNLSVTGITGNSANIGWSDAVTVDIDYGTPGHPAGTGTIVNSISTNPYTLGGLTASTSYDVFVRQNCGATFSSWVGPLSFTTNCGIASAPWSQDFEGAAFPPTCWTKTASPTWLRATTCSGYGIGAASAEANFYSISAVTPFDLVTFEFDASGLANPQLKFDWAYSTYSGEIDEMDVYYSTNSGSTWTLLLAMPGGTNGILNPYHLVNGSPYTPTAGQWSTLTLALPAGSNMVKFTAISAYGNNLYLDNAGVQEGPTVPVFSLSPTSKDFGLVYLGSSSTNQTFTITNTGAGTLTIASGGISIVGTNSDQFILTDANTYPINLTAGQSATIDVNFTPTSAGSKSADLQIVDNLTDATHTAPLTGIGAALPVVPYFTNFDALTAGQQLACQDAGTWTTWSNLPCSAEDPYVSSTYAYSGANSVKIVMNNDCVKPLLSQTSGKWTITFMTYIPTGKAGYFNTLALFAGGSSEWGMECYFDVTGGGRLFGGSATATNFTWTADTWKMVKVVVDLNLDNAEFYYDNLLIKTWQWTLGSSGGGCPLQLDANDFFGATADDEMYFDDYSIQPVINTFQLSVDIASGWNMVSVPGNNPDGQTVNDWWINHTGTVYEFVPGSGYNGITNTLPGDGYWMKNNSAQIYNTGDEWPAGGIEFVTHNPISVVSGWNMFGGYENVVDVLNLTTTPPDKIVYPIYKYIPGSGYGASAQLVPGYGYWVKVSADCQITMPDALAKSNGKIAELFKDNWGKITLTDAAGSSYTLYVVKGEVDLNQYELPPLPPSGLFDVRFGSSRVAEDISSDFKSIEMRGITYPVRVKVENTDIRLMDVSGKLINTNVKDGEEITINNASIDKVMVTGQLIPDKYSLEQNYPNPFNPSTTIQFSLPENVKNVRISVYNVLGQKVSELVNGEMLAGKYQYQWNAKNFASGMYIYELRTEKFVSIKKMMLLK